MKFEWKKQEKSLYLPKEKPALIIVPKQKFLMIKGSGNPDNEVFNQKVSLLYSLSYTIKMMPRQGYTPEGYFDYTVYPLEGVWDLTEQGRKYDSLNKDELVYKIMIRQPDFVSEEVVEKALEKVRKKKADDLLENIIFDTMEDGLCVQMMHIGSYDDEQDSFDKINQFMKENGLERISLQHREIYISDPKKTIKTKLKTVLRYSVCYK